MSAFILWRNTATCYYWILSIILLIVMLYYVVSAIVYLIFVHRHQKQLQKQELLTYLNGDISVQFQRFRLWVAGHTNRIIFILLSCSDMILEIFTTSISSDGKVIVNKPGSILTFSCSTNAYIRFVFYMLSNFIFSLFSWYKCQLVYTSMQPTESIAKCIPFLVKSIFWYIIATYPMFLIWGSFELHSNSWTQSDGDMRLCYIYFPAPLFVMFFAHDLMLFVLLFILFMIPLGYQHKRAKRVQTFSTKKQQNMNYSYDEYTKYKYCNIISNDSNTKSKQNSPNTPFSRGTGSNSSHNVNDTIAVTDELQAAMIRNGIAGSFATIIATLFLTAFYFASWHIATTKHSQTSHDYHNRQRLWTSGFMVMANFLRYLVLYICMTVTYKDWKTMLCPWKCCKNYSETHSNINSVYVAQH